MFLHYTHIPLTIGMKHGSMILDLAMFWWPNNTAVISTLAIHYHGWIQGWQAAPPPLFDLAQVTLSSELKVPMSMGQHHKLPMNGDFFPLRNLNEKQEEWLQLHSPYLHSDHLKAVHSEIG